ncbi:unnamed protein product, partial [Didymodactylos carnosus]
GNSRTVHRRAVLRTDQSEKGGRQVREISGSMQAGHPQIRGKIRSKFRSPLLPRPRTRGCGQQARKTCSSVQCQGRVLSEVPL